MYVPKGEGIRVKSGKYYESQRRSAHNNYHKYAEIKRANRMAHYYNSKLEDIAIRWLNDWSYEFRFKAKTSAPY